MIQNKNGFMITVFLSIILLASPITINGVFAQQDNFQNKNSKDQKIIKIDEKQESLTKKIKDRHDGLIIKAQNEGTVRVIIELDADSQTPITKQDKSIQKQNIKNAQNSLKNSLSSSGIMSSRNFENMPFVTMTVTPAVLDELLNSKMVKSVQEDRLNKISLADSIPIIGADVVHASGQTASGAIVGILDTGVDANHVFLGSGTRVVDESCFSFVSAFSTGCPNNADVQLGPGSAAPCNVSLHSGCAHGTHVAGIAAGSGGPAAAPVGVATNANIAAVQVFTLFTGGVNCPGPNNCLGAFDADILAGLDHILTLKNGGMNIASVNLSLGGDSYTSECDALFPSYATAINDLKNAGVATIVASGNDAFANAISVPACISNAISVGSTDKNDQVPIYSNEATFLDLLAPGGDTSKPNGGITSSIPGNLYAEFQGTSMATPHVTGTWALLKQAHSGASHDELLYVLKNTGKPVLETFANLIKPRINVDLALDALDYAPLCGKSVLDFSSFIFGTSGDDILSGTSGNDLIIGYGGNDSIKGNGGDDCLFGGDGADKLSGGDGNDYLSGDADNDSLNGGSGNDDIYGGSGDDTLSGVDGQDNLFGQDGNDSLKGGSGADVLNGGFDNDVLSGGDNNDTLNGGDGDDYVLGRTGDDAMSGGNGFDICIGGGEILDSDTECEIVV